MDIPWYSRQKHFSTYDQLSRTDTLFQKINFSKEQGTPDEGKVIENIPKAHELTREHFSVMGAAASAGLER